MAVGGYFSLIFRLLLLLVVCIVTYVILYGKFTTFKIESRHFSTKRPHALSNDGQIFVFGASGVNSSENSTWDTFKVCGQRHSRKPDLPLQCCLKYPDGDVTQHPVIADWWFYTKLGVPVPLFNIECANTRHKLSGDSSVPTGISVVYEDSSCQSQSVEYVKPYLPQRRSNNSLAITTKISHGNLSADLVITWMEAYLWLGADKVITYALSNLSSDARAVMEYYAKRGVLELYDYQMPAKDTVPRSLPMQWPQTWTDAAVPMFDAFARSSGYTYFSVIDWDEFIIPSGNRTLKQLMETLFTKRKDAAGFQFKTQFFITSIEPDDDSDIYLNRFVYRLNKDPVFDRRKLIFKPQLARLKGSHGIAPIPGYKSLFCPISAAYTRHYRGCLPKDPSATNCLRAPELNLIRDGHVASWAADKIAENVRRARAEIFPSVKKQ